MIQKRRYTCRNPNFPYSGFRNNNIFALKRTDMEFNSAHIVYVINFGFVQKNIYFVVHSGNNAYILL